MPYEVAQEVGSIRGFVEEKIQSGKALPEVAAELAKKYPADERTVLAALKETVESVQKGFKVPTDKRVTFEDWEDFIILQANFGSLANRAFALLLGDILSERTGVSVVVQHDPYRIFVQTMGEMSSSTIMRTIDEMKNASPEFIKDTLTRGCVKTGIFKRRMIHVARRFGALKKYVDFSNVSLRSLVKSFESTIIYEEALKEVFAKDLDPDRLVEVFRRIKTGEIELVKIEAKNEPSPVARVGIERVSMKTDLIPPEKMRRILLEAAKARLLDEVRTFVCTNCWNYAEMLTMKDLPEKPACPKCDSVNLGLLSVPEEEAFSLIDKKGEKLTQREHKLRNRAVATAKLISNYGKTAAVAFSGRRLKVDDVHEILKKQKTLSDDFFDLVIEAERTALKRKFL